MRPAVLDPAARAEARRLWSMGYSARFIAEALGVERRQVPRMVGARPAAARAGRRG